MTHTLLSASRGRRLPAVLWLTALAMLGAGQTFAQTYEESKKPLATAVEKVLTEFVDKSEVEKRKQLTAYMDEVLKRVDAAAKLTPEELEAVKQEAAKAVARSIIVWRPRFTEGLRSFLTRRSEPAAISHIGQWKPPIAGAREPVEGWSAPDNDPVWIAALKARLGDQRFADWRKADDVVQAGHDAAVADHVKRWGDEYRTVMNRAVQFRIEEWSKALKPSEDRVTALKTAVQAMMERVLESEQKRATAMLRPMPANARSNIMGRKTFYIRFPFAKGADLNNVWDETLNGTLTREERAAWTRHVAEQKAALEKSISALMQPALAQVRGIWEQALGLEANHIISALNLPANRAVEFKAATKAALSAMEARWLKRTKEEVDLADSESLKQMVKSGRFYFGYDVQDQPHNDAAWNESIKAILSTDERKQLETIKAEDKLRRNRIMSQIMIAELDRQVIFTAKQRQQLQPLAERLAKNVSEPRPSFGSDIDVQTFFTAAKEATDAELAPILDANQRTHWRESCKAVENPQDEEEEKPVVAQPKVTPKTLEPEDFEHRLSEYLQEMTTVERQRMLGQMILRAEDAARVAGLTEQVAARLRTAAKGATERILTPWKSRIEQVARAAVKGVSAQNLKQQLGRLEEYHFRQNTSVTPADHLIWSGTVQAELTEPQRAAWKKEIDARKAFRDHAMAGAVMADFDRKYKLTFTQWNKLEPVIQKAVSDYAQDIESYFSSTNPWYLQSYSSLLPFAAVPEKDLQTLLTKDQWDRWTGEGLATVSNYWDNIKQAHERRLKLVK